MVLKTITVFKRDRCLALGLDVVSDQAGITPWYTAGASMGSVRGSKGRLPVREAQWLRQFWHGFRLAERNNDERKVFKSSVR